MLEESFSGKKFMGQEGRKALQVFEQDLFSIAQNVGCRLLFLPPYSPKLNPIEHFWAWLKHFLHKILSAAPPLGDAISTVFLLW